MNSTVAEPIAFVNYDRSFLLILKTAAFLGAIWIIGRSLRKLQLPPNVGWLAAGVLLGPEALQVVPFASRTCFGASVIAAAVNTSSASGLSGTYASTPASPAAAQWETAACGEDLWRLAGNVGITLLIFEFGTQASDRLPAVREPHSPIMAP